MSEPTVTRFNGVAKVISWSIPVLAVIYFMVTFFFNMGQSVQENADTVRRLNQRLCVVESEELPKPIVDPDCPLRR